MIAKISSGYFAFQSWAKATSLKGWAAVAARPAAASLRVWRRVSIGSAPGCCRDSLLVAPAPGRAEDALTSGDLLAGALRFGGGDGVERIQRLGAGILGLDAVELGRDLAGQRLRHVVEHDLAGGHADQAVTVFRGD